MMICSLIALSGFAKSQVFARLLKRVWKLSRVSQIKQRFPLFFFLAKLGKKIRSVSQLSLLFYTKGRFFRSVSYLVSCNALFVLPIYGY